MANVLTMCVKQGENISREVSITVSGGQPFDLTNYDNITVEVKKAPYEQFEPIFTKVITQDSDMDTMGRITNPSQGKFQIRFTEEDTSIPATDYYLIIYLNGNGSSDIISSNCCNNAIYRVCSQ